jgi:hypothetical protein
LTAEATKSRDRALEVGNPWQLYQIQPHASYPEQKPEGASAFFRSAVKRAPESLAGRIAKARLYSSEGNFDGAIEGIKAAQPLPGVSEALVKALDPALKRLENHEDIN